MSEATITAAVREFYERHPFPGVRTADRDGLIMMRRLSRRNGPLRVLDAGCGTGNTSVALARVLKAANILGVDICSASLKRARALAKGAGVSNVRFRSADLMDLDLKEDAPFDVILCLGVLHHTSDMPRGLRNLAALLADDGELYLWMYGVHGRYVHTLNRRLIDMLADPAWSLDRKIAFAREFATGTHHGEPLRDLYGRDEGTAAWNDVVLADTWIADQFLHVHERPVSMDDLLELLDGAGLEIRAWMDLPPQSTCDLSPGVALRIEQLEQRARFRALDLLLKPRQYFVSAGRAEHPDRS